MEELGTLRLAKCLLLHPQVLQGFNISHTVSALSGLALAPSYESRPVAGPRAQIVVATPLCSYAAHHAPLTRPASKLLTSLERDNHSSLQPPCQTPLSIASYGEHS